MNMVNYEKSYFLCLFGYMFFSCTKKLLVSVNCFTHDYLLCTCVCIYICVSFFPTWLLLLKCPNRCAVSYLLIQNLFSSFRNALYVDNTIFACFNEIGLLSWIHSGPGHTWILAGSHLIPWFSPQLWSYHLSLTQVWTMDSLPS